LLLSLQCPGLNPYSEFDFFCSIIANISDIRKNDFFGSAKECNKSLFPTPASTPGLFFVIKNQSHNFSLIPLLRFPEFVKQELILEK
jgi:hypothetical protein